MVSHPKARQARYCLNSVMTLSAGLFLSNLKPLFINPKPLLIMAMPSRTISYTRRALILNKILVKITAFGHSVFLECNPHSNPKPGFGMESIIQHSETFGVRIDALQNSTPDRGEQQNKSQPSPCLNPNVISAYMHTLYYNGVG